MAKNSPKASPDASKTSPDLSHISEPLRLFAVETSTLSSDPANARSHPERNLEVIVSSLRQFGQQKPIVVDARGIVVAGNGTLEGAKALVEAGDKRWARIAAIRTSLSDADRTAYAIADNRSGELATWNDEVLARLVQGLPDPLREVAGFNASDIEALLNRISPALPEGEQQSEPELKSEHLVEIRLSGARLEEIRGTLNEWSELDGVTVDIS